MTDRNNNLGQDDKMLLIRNYDLFAHLSENEFEELNLIHNFINAKRGEYIYFEARHLNKLFFIKEGFIKIGYIDNSGNEIIKEIIQKGEVFGQFTLERDNLNGEFAQVHKSDVSLCAFTIENFRNILNRNNKIAIAYSTQVGNKLRKVENRLINMLNTDVKTRILRLIHELIHSNESFCENARFIIPNFLTHNDIARLIGSSRQTVTVAINELETAGYIKINRKQIEIPDIHVIEKAAAI
jgi:CRP/FNR family transcriptional regulator